MAELLLRVLARAGQTIYNPFSMGGEYVRPQKGDLARDFGRIAGDMRIVGADLTTVAVREVSKQPKGANQPKHGK